MRVGRAEMAAEGVTGPYSRHLPALDGLRGLAILGVLGFHLFPGNVPGRLLGLVGELRVLGVAGVDLFFVLSGFLITGILWDSLGERRYFRTFYARRALRIFPLYYGVLATVFLLTPWLGLAWHGMQWVLLVYLQNTDVAGRFYDLVPGAGISLDHFWTLAVEEQFYLVWPVVVFAVRDRRRLMGVCLVMAAVALLLRFGMSLEGAEAHLIERWTVCRMDTLLAGAWVALALRGERPERVLGASKLVFWGASGMLVAVGVAALLGVGRVGEAACLTLRYSLVALASAGLLAWCLRPETAVARVLAGRGLRWFGRYSYGFYVLHFVALGLLLRVFKGWIGMVTPSKGAGVIGAGGMVFAASVGAAWVSYRLYERPFLKLKRYFPYEGG